MRSRSMGYATSPLRTGQSGDVATPAEVRCRQGRDLASQLQTDINPQALVARPGVRSGTICGDGSVSVFANQLGDVSELNRVGSVSSRNSPSTMTVRPAQVGPIGHGTSNHGRAYDLLYRASPAEPA